MIENCYGQLEIDIENISYDSRYTDKGDLFVCISGVIDDGHNYLQDAIEKGAVAIVAETDRLTEDKLQMLINRQVPLVLVPDARKAMGILVGNFFNYPGDKLRLIGVTGTKGKSTTVNLIDQLLYQGLNTKTGLVGTVNTRIAGKHRQIPTTTPGPWELQNMLYELVDYGATHTTLEVSSHAVTQHRTLGVDFDIAVYTNLGEDHLDYHGSLDNYLNAKGRFFSTLGTSPTKNGRAKLAVINIDDPYSEYIIEQTSVQVITYGFNHNALVQGELIESNENNTKMNIISPWGSVTINTPLVGKFNCYNILAAVTVALIEGVSLNEIAKLLQEPDNVPGRFEKIDLGQNFSVIVDFAHTADSLENVLSAVKNMTTGRVGVVFGCGGERDKGKRPVMGKVACNYCDFIVVTSDNPRSESPDQIIEDIISGVSEECRQNLKVISDRDQAIEYALSWAQTGDALLIAGKGHETTQEINGEIINFDDRQIVREKLLQMGY